MGGKLAAKRLNEVNYQVAKLMLGLAPSYSLGVGGKRVRVLAETRFLTRLGTDLAQRIIVAGARLLVLPSGTPVEMVLRAAERVTVTTWLDDGRGVMLDVCIMEDFWAGRDLAHLRANRKSARAEVKRWNNVVVIPCLRRVEEVWFRDQLVGLSSAAAIPYAELVPLGQPFGLGPLGKTMWRFYRAWIIARITGGIPFAAWGAGGVPKSADTCTLCGLEGASLRHVLVDSPELLSFRMELPCEGGCDLSSGR